ncbi:MAG: radical SAM protein [Candidatus Margulisbacteria bacterium]|nr:radical SAM protein [Candidatus Margulisiibacteriota bacterium]MBU1616607.1 radical SAM protein [Candidatus Margulisiibacteriota bacterium]
MVGQTEEIRNCRLCGHRCGVNRLAGERCLCRAGADIEIASYCLHHGEEPIISGTQGSGTIFFARCSLRCVFCQNYQISTGIRDTGIRETGLVEIMLELQAQRAHNINLVSPTHYGPQIIEAIKQARAQGLKLPIVWNSSGYDSLELLEALTGMVDIYLPDFKYGDDEAALKYSGAPNYFETAKAAIFEMFRQVGPQGLVVRHLVLPNGISGSRRVLGYLASLSPEIQVSLMAQYSPRHLASQFPELSRTLTIEEYTPVLAYAEKLGLRNIFAQELTSQQAYLPDFERTEPFSK